MDGGNTQHEVKLAPSLNLELTIRARLSGQRDSGIPSPTLGSECTATMPASCMLAGDWSFHSRHIHILNTMKFNISIPRTYKSELRK